MARLFRNPSAKLADDNPHGMWRIISNPKVTTSARVGPVGVKTFGPKLDEIKELEAESYIVGIAAKRSFIESGLEGSNR